MSQSFIKMICRLLIVSLLGLMMPAKAAIMPTESSVQGAQAERAHVAAFLARDDVRAQLQSNGVTAEQALQRVQALSDDEVRDLAGKIDELPVGADGGVIGVLLTIFIVLLITDILGFTKVFPFTRSIR